MHDENDGVKSEVENGNIKKEKLKKAKVTKEKNIKGEVIKKAAAKKAASKQAGIKKAAKEETVTKKAAMEMNAARNKMLILLEQMRQKGVKLFVDGEAAQPEEIASKAVCEGSTYMADYVLGENGTIEQVRFDNVTGR